MQIIKLNNNSRILKDGRIIDHGQIEINCICGNKYFVDRGRICLCPRCKHVWLLKPPHNN